MRISSSVPAMIALAAVLSVPFAVAAQTSTTNSPATQAPTRPLSSTAATATPAPLTTTTAPHAMASTDSTYVTADQHIRASKIVGASVYNDQDQKIGSIDDVLIGSNDDISGVVLSVGGFLGIDSKLVEVPYKQIQVNNDKLTMSGATKDDLTRLPEYAYKARS